MRGLPACLWIMPGLVQGGLQECCYENDRYESFASSSAFYADVSKEIELACTSGAPLQNIGP